MFKIRLNGFIFTVYRVIYEAALSSAGKLDTDVIQSVRKKEQGSFK